jgi:hypothetical protein
MQSTFCARLRAVAVLLHLHCVIPGPAEGRNPESRAAMQ